MTKTFAVAGKGGVGKTTFSGMLITHLASKKGAILAVDADPNANLHQKLGVDVEETIGQIREDMLKEADTLSPSMSKQEYVEFNIRRALVEEDAFDLLAMGRQEGSGCYCYINNVMRTFIDTLSDKYDHVVIDNEAGMEHLSRRTTRDIDVLFFVTDATKQGIMTAIRIKKLADEMELNIGHMMLVINRAPEVIPEHLTELAKGDFADIAVIPRDDVVERFALEETPVSRLPADSKAYQAVVALVDALR